jgi:hypothetical protein
MQTPGKTRISSGIDLANLAAIDAEALAKKLAREKRDGENAALCAKRVKELISNPQHDAPEDGPEA